MSNTDKTLIYRVLLLATLCICWPTSAFAGIAPLTRAEIETTMAIRDQADALRLKALDLASREKSGEESFAETMAIIQRIGREADLQACDEQGIQVQEYRDRLRRLIKVGELVLFEDVQAELQKELRQRQSKTDADLALEAEQTMASTEEWHKGVQGGSTTAGEGDQEAQPLPAGYSDSLEQIVMEPMRQQAADGSLPDVMKQANDKRIAEIHQQLSGIDRELSAPSMHQAILDKPAALSLFDPVTLQGLSSSLVDDIPLSAFEE